MSMGERVKSARFAAGMSLRELAGRVGVSHTAIAKYEGDLDVPSSDVLLRLAHELGVKVDYFFRPSAVGAVEARYRKRSCLPAKAERALVGQIRDAAERYVDVEFLLSHGTVPFEMPEGFPMAVASMEGAEAAADALRCSWLLGSDPIENLTALLEDRGLVVHAVDADRRFDACAFWADGRPVIAVNRAFPGDRQRLSLAHELAHILLVPADGLPQERLAQRFAGAFLVPAGAVRLELGMVRRWLDPFELHLLKHKWGLSMKAWVVRARDAGVLTEAGAVRHFKWFNKEAWAETEPWDPLPAEEPSRLVKLVLRALAENLVSSSRASELLGMSLTEFWRQQSVLHGEGPGRVCS